MYNKAMLGLDQCQAAINAMIAEFKKDPNNSPIAMAIVDDAGNLIHFASTDRCRTNTLRNTMAIVDDAGNLIHFATDRCRTNTLRNTIKKSTAAMGGVDSVAYGERLKSQGRNVSEMGDPMLFPVQGGVVILNPIDGSVLGGIGVAGLPDGKKDEDIARTGLNAMNL